MRRTLQLATVALLLCGVAAAADADIYHTSTLFNGRFWQTLDDKEKLIYVAACRDAIDMITTTEHAADGKDAIKNSVASLQIWVSGDFTIGDYGKALDSFYATPENVRVPIIMALRYCTVKFNGMSSKNLEDMAAGLRQLAAKLSN
jgi:hypothetical protein